VATYYVAEGGTATDQAKENATSGTYPGGCMSPAGHNAETFAAGDSILLSDEGGDIRAKLVTPSLGSDGNQIVYDAKSGDTPVLSGSDLVTGFTGGGAPSPVDTVDAPGITQSFTASADCQVEANFTYESGKYIRIQIRKATSSSYVYVTAESDRSIVLGYYNGSFNEVDTDEGDVFTDGVNYDIKVIANGTTVTAYVDDVEKVSGTVSHNSTTENGYLQGNLVSDDLSAVIYDYPASGTENIWEATVTTEPKQVFMDGQYGDKKASAEACVNEYDWFWTGSTLTVYATSDPDTLYTDPGVEAGARDACWEYGRDYLLVQNITFRHSNGLGANFYGVVGTDVKDCIFEWNKTDGLYFGGTTPGDGSGEISGNIARYNGRVGIAANGNEENMTIKQNTAHHNGYQDDEEWTAGIKLWGNYTGGTGNIIEENLVYDNGPAGGSVDGGLGAGIWVDECAGTPKSVIRFNKVYDNNGPGIFIEKIDNCECYGNVVYDCAVNSTNWASSGILLVSTAGTMGCDSCLIYNNTVTGCQHGLRVQGYSTAQIVDCEIKNNILSGNIDAELYCGQGGDNDTTNGSGNVYQYNCLGAEATGFVYWGSSRDTYDAWETQYGGTTNSVESDPSFTNAGADDYTLASDSPCIGAGVNLGASYDDALLPSSTWPDGVVTGDQDDY